MTDPYFAAPPLLADGVEFVPGKTLELYTPARRVYLDPETGDFNFKTGYPDFEVAGAGFTYPIRKVLPERVILKAQSLRFRGDGTAEYLSEGYHTRESGVGVRHIWLLSVPNGFGNDLRLFYSSLDSAIRTAVGQAVAEAQAEIQRLNKALATVQGDIQQVLENYSAYMGDTDE